MKRLTVISEVLKIYMVLPAKSAGKFNVWESEAQTSDRVHYKELNISNRTLVSSDNTLTKAREIRKQLFDKSLGLK